MVQQTLMSDQIGTSIPLATDVTPGAITKQYTSDVQNLGSLTFTGTPPGGTVAKSYFWTVNGRQATITWKIKASVAGLLVTSVTTPLPADCPLPLVFPDQNNDEWAYMGSGALLSSGSDNPAGGATCGLYRDASGNYQLKINSGSVSVGARFAKGLCTYITAG